MLPLSTAELKQMRDTATVALTGTAVLAQPSRTADGQGGETWTYNAVGTVVGRLAPVPNRTGEMDIAGQLGILNPYIITLPFDARLDIDYRITWQGSSLFEVKTNMPHQPWEITQRWMVQELR